MLQHLVRHQDTPPDAFALDHDRQQVSWLTGHRVRPPSQGPCPSPVAYYGRQLSAYSCGGSRGLVCSRTRTAFPWLALAGTTGHKRGIGSCRESIDCPPLRESKVSEVAAGPHRRSIDAIQQTTHLARRYRRTGVSARGAYRPLHGASSRVPHPVAGNAVAATMHRVLHRASRGVSGGGPSQIAADARCSDREFPPHQPGRLAAAEKLRSRSPNFWAK
jgi:hypothetical protein